MNEWYPIESCPKDGTVFDTWLIILPPWKGSPHRVSDCYWGKSGVMKDEYYGPMYVEDKNVTKLTHWRPIPFGPNQGE